MSKNIDKINILLFILFSFIIFYFIGIFVGSSENLNKEKDTRHIQAISDNNLSDSSFSYYLANSHSYWFPLEKPSYFKVVRPINKFDKEIIRKELEIFFNEPIIGIQKPNFLPIEMLAVLSELLNDKTHKPKKIIFSMAYYNFYDNIEIREEVKNILIKEDNYNQLLYFLKKYNYDNLYTHMSSGGEILKSIETKELSLFDNYEVKLQTVLVENFTSIDWLLNNLKIQILYIYYSLRDYILQELLNIRFDLAKKDIEIEKMDLNIKSIDAILKICQINNIEVIGYFAPIKRGLDTPYNIDDLNNWIYKMNKLFKNYDNSKLINTSNLFREKEYWGYYDTRPDWTHIKSQGHYILVKQIIGGEK
jgi:hypothetical protein